MKVSERQIRNDIVDTTRVPKDNSTSIPKDWVATNMHNKSEPRPLNLSTRKKNLEKPDLRKLLRD